MHIGDDFVKDVVAAKTLNMRAIWATELIQDKLRKQQAESRINSNQSAPADDGKNKMNVEKFVQKVSEMKVIEMPVGADNYLVDSIQREFVDAVVDDFSNLAPTISKWHEDGVRAVELQRPTTEILVNTGTTEVVVDSIYPNDDNNPLSVVLPDEMVNVKSDVASGMMTNKSNGKEPAATSAVPAESRVFRLVRDDCKMDVPAPLLDRDIRKMKDVLEMAQMDKSSGVFSFPADDIQAFREGKLVLMIDVIDANITFSREIFVGMTVNEVLALTDKNPLELSLSMKTAAPDTGFDLF